MTTNNFDPVLIGIVRKYMANVIAHDIAGVQPMTGPSADVFKMRARYSGSGRLSNNHYRYFLRLYNRRKYHDFDSFNKAGYPFIVTTAPYISNEWLKWMRENIGQYRYFRFGDTIFFEDQKLIVLYQLRWG